MAARFDTPRTAASSLPSLHKISRISRQRDPRNSLATAASSTCFEFSRIFRIRHKPQSGLYQNHIIYNQPPLLILSPFTAAKEILTMRSTCVWPDPHAIPLSCHVSPHTIRLSSLKDTGNHSEVQATGSCVMLREEESWEGKKQTVGTLSRSDWMRDRTVACGVSEEN